MDSGGVFGFVFEGLPARGALGLALVGAAVLVTLYLAKPRRRTVVVAFAPLWFGAVGAPRAERRARRLRSWLSLALQLAILGALVVAAAAPRPVADDAAGRGVVVLVDRSASMSATDEPGGRLEAARGRARELIRSLGPADRVLVASFAADVAAESGFEPATDTGAPRLARALERIAPSATAADLPRALAFAAALLRGRPHATILLVSDGAFTDDARAQVRWDRPGGDGASLAGLDVRWAPVGRRARNVAIVSFGARALPADPTTVEAAVTIHNFGDAAAAPVLEIAAGPTLVERVPLALAPGEARRHVLPDVAAPDERLVARLVRPDGAPWQDDLALDDRAETQVPRPRRLRVLEIGAGDLYLDGALLSLGDGVSVERARPDAAESTRARWGDFDVVVLDGVAPAPAPAAGHFLYVAPRGPGSPFPARGTIAAPTISDARRAHPLLREVDLADVNIARADRLSLGAGDVAVASSFGAPLIAARERAGLRVCALAFELRQSDLPLRPAFPLLLSNALTWLAAAPPDAAAAATRLADPRESDTTPARALVLGGREVPRVDAAPAARHAGFAISTWALLAALALLLVEWVSTNRRWTV